MARPRLSDHAICQVSVASLRRLPSHSSALISQVLFGERIQIISKRTNDWMRVQCSWDDITGWVDAKQFYVLKERDMKVSMECSVYALDHLHGLKSSDSVIPISIGSDLINYDGLNVKLPFKSFQYSGQIVSAVKAHKNLDLIKSIVSRYMHSPHLEGGRSILGIDASGFIQMVFKLIGVSVPRTLDLQANLGYDIGFVDNMQIGDIAFFGSDEKNIEHAGIILGPGEIIHVHGMVRKDTIDQEGLYSKKKKYLFRLRSIRRLI